MINSAFLVVPGVLMGIELNQSQRTMFFNMGLEQRIRDEMISTNRQQIRAGVRTNEGGCIAFYDIRHVRLMAIVELAKTKFQLKMVFLNLVKKRDVVMLLIVHRV